MDRCGPAPPINNLTLECKSEVYHITHILTRSLPETSANGRDSRPQRAKSAGIQKPAFTEYPVVFRRIEIRETAIGIERQLSDAHPLVTRVEIDAHEIETGTETLGNREHFIEAAWARNLIGKGRQIVRSGEW